MLLMIDNYDSFTYNIVQYFGELNQEVKVVRNDSVTLDDIERWQPKYLVIGPGPCSPTEAGISIPAIQHFAGKIPLLGVCLGHQSIGQAFGGKIIRAKLSCMAVYLTCITMILEFSVIYLHPFQQLVITLW